MKFAQKDFAELFETNEEVRQAAFELLYDDKIVDKVVPNISLNDETESFLDDIEDVN